MDIGIISSRYARALLKFATAKGENADVYAGMTAMGFAFQKVSNLRDTLEDPVLPDEKKQRILIAAAGDTKSECLKEFFKLVTKNRRIAMVQFMAHSYISAYRKQQKLIHSQLTVPSPLDNEITERLKALVKDKTNCQVEFTVEQDPSIIGGFILEYDTYRFDGSVKGKLQSIRRQLLEAGK